MALYCAVFYPIQSRIFFLLRNNIATLKLHDVTLVTTKVNTGHWAWATCAATSSAVDSLPELACFFYGDKLWSGESGLLNLTKSSILRQKTTSQQLETTDEVFWLP